MLHIRTFHRIMILLISFICLKGVINKMRDIEKVIEMTVSELATQSNISEANN
ncbi:hypothetical protein [Clostridium sp.]|uniref:hypothetical protein n=1 Tax=Clostridium sp. TaxID=1506 RepID=UPI0025C4168D|nr:hypothetical protein [Clostridium sp.]